MIETGYIPKGPSRLLHIAGPGAEWNVHKPRQAEDLRMFILPTVCPVVTFHYRSGIQATGPLRPRRYSNLLMGVQTAVATIHPTGPVGAVSIRLKPEGVRRLTRSPIDQPLSLDDLMSATELSVLEERLQDEAAVGKRAEILSQAIEARVDHELTPNATETAAALLRRRPSASITTIAERVGLSERHLTRTFQAMFGISPKMFARLARIDKVFAMINPQLGWADAAHACGYTDQAHMINDFNKLCGNSPNRIYEQLMGSNQAAANMALRRNGYSNYYFA